MPKKPATVWASFCSDSVGALPGAVNQTSDRFLDEMDRLTDSLRAANDRFGGARR